MRLKQIDKRYEVQLVFDEARQLGNEQCTKFDELFQNLEKQKLGVKDFLVYTNNTSEIAIFKDRIDLKGVDVNSMIDILNKCAAIFDIDLNAHKNPVIIDCFSYYNDEKGLSAYSQLAILDEFVYPRSGTRIMGIRYLDFLTPDDTFNSIIVELNIDPQYFVTNLRIFTTYEKVHENIDLLHNYLKVKFEDKEFMDVDMQIGEDNKVIPFASHGKH